MASVEVHGISSRIDGCARLIYKQSNHFYSRIPQEHKTWIDLEDVLQESLIAAWHAEQSYAKRWGKKTAEDAQNRKGRRSFPTYMAYGVRNQFTSVFRSPLSQQKRMSSGVESLDAPVAGTEDVQLADTLASNEISPEQLEMATSTFRAVGARLGGTGAAVFVAVYCFGIWPRLDARRMNCAQADIRRAMIRVGNVDVMQSAAGSNFFRRKTLTIATEFTKMKLTGGHDLKVLDCVGCRGLFSLTDVLQGKFLPETLTCAGCYRKMAKSSPSASCFGKAKTNEHEGFSAEDPDCKLHCKDRKVCRQYIESGGRNMANASVDEVEDTDFDGTEDADFDEASSDTGDEGDDEEEVAETKPAKPAKSAKTSKSKTSKPAKAAKSVKATATKASKSAKPAKAAKPEKSEKVADGRDLPFKANSAMRYCLEQALKPGGVKVSTLEASLLKQGYTPKFQIKMLRSGQSNGRGLLPYPITHTWKISEENGIIKASAVKRIATYDKLERVYASKSHKAAAKSTPKAAKKTASKKK